MNNSSFQRGSCDEETTVRRQWFRCVTRKVGRGGKSKKTKGNNMHTLVHTNMSETDAGCHARPPTVHNERHSPFCSGSPTVNTILSHWASSPPSCPPFYLSLFSLCSTFLSQSTLEQPWSDWGEKVKVDGERATEGADPQDSLETSVGPCSSLLHAPVPSTCRGSCAQERLLYLGICAALLGGWREGGEAPQASAPL